MLKANFACLGWVLVIIYLKASLAVRLDADPFEQFQD